MTVVDSVSYIGYRWWGPGPDDFVRHSNANQASYIAVADLTSTLSWPLVRWPKLLDTRVRILARAHGASANNRQALTIVFCPHRLSRTTLGVLRARSNFVVAWLGDVPTGVRGFSHTHRYYDEIFSPDPSWTQSGPVNNTVLTWPHLVPAGAAASASRLEQLKLMSRSAVTLAIIGTAYPERVTFARSIIDGGWKLRVVGRGWPESFAADMPIDRLTLIENLVRNQNVVLNIAHKQMFDTLNPMFADLAAAGVPQIYVSPFPGYGTLPPHERIAPGHTPTFETISSAINLTEDLQIWAQSTQSVDHKLNQIVAGLSL